MAFVSERRTPLPLWHLFQSIFLPHFFSFAIESYLVTYLYETVFTSGPSQDYHF